MSYQDNIRNFWAFGNPKAPHKLYKLPSMFLETDRINKKGREQIKMNGFTSVHKKMSDYETDLKTSAAMTKAIECQRKINEKREAKKIKLIDFEDTPVPQPEQTHSQKTSKTEIKKCKAINLSNKPCGYKAVCGDFCKRHAPP